jgi:membrane fusion protein (multidrug efflux system)
MIKRMVIMLVIVGVVLGGIFAFETFKAGMIRKFIAAAGQPVQTVSTVRADLSDWQPSLSAVGSLTAIQGINLAAEVAGTVAELHFESGDDVRRGALLLRLRPNDDDAKLAQLQAVADTDQTTYDRDLRQLRAQAVSQATVDTDAGTLRAARAQVAQQQALMDEKFVRAPFDGHLGIRQVSLGQVLSAGAAIVTLQALDPIFVDFYVPQQSIAVLKVGQTATVHVDSFAGENFPAEITAINPLVDSSSRNVQVRASLKNPDHKLLPGMFATVTVSTGGAQQYVTLPETAISYNPYGSTVFLVDQPPASGDALTVSQHFVTTGDTRGDQVAVLKGIAAGATVVSAGQLKLRNGTKVKIDNTVQPPDNPNPMPYQQ